MASSAVAVRQLQPCHRGQPAGLLCLPGPADDVNGKLRVGGQPGRPVSRLPDNRGGAGRAGEHMVCMV